MAISADHERLLLSYAAGDVSWTSLRGQGIDNYRDVLAGLGELGLRPPDAPIEGPNVEARRHRERSEVTQLHPGSKGWVASAQRASQ